MTISSIRHHAAQREAADLVQRHFVAPSYEELARLTGAPASRPPSHLRLVPTGDALSRAVADQNDYLAFRRSA